VNLRINCIPEPFNVHIDPEKEFIRRLTQIHADGINTGSRFYLNGAGTFASERRNASDELALGTGYILEAVSFGSVLICG
jgi:hypothetical protein